MAEPQASQIGIVAAEVAQNHNPRHYHAVAFAGRLEVVGEYHVGEFINRFRKGSLAMQAPEAGATPPPTMLFGTVNGVLGLVATISTQEYELLAKVQTQLTKVIRCVGGFSHATWRSFCNERKTVEASNILDGDLIEQFLELGPDEMERVSCVGVPPPPCHW